jgi:arginine decarboxylase
LDVSPGSFSSRIVSVIEQVTSSWTVAEAMDLYDLPRWGNGYFSISPQGHLCVHPEKDPQRQIDLKALVDQLQLRGLELPILLRFNGILKDRLREMHDVFRQAIDQHEYKGGYSCVYPIKVNQQRQVVEEIVYHGKHYGFGLEAGSKPELLAVVAMTDSDMPIICNGFKDAEFIEMAMLAQRIGRHVIPVVEKYTELDLILKYAERVGVRPQIGMRVKLAARGSGRWQASGGYRSKFGLTVGEILDASRCCGRGMSDCFKLLHFHLGSQITNIRHIKAAINEAARVYVDLARRGTGLEYLDIGGGLGVDYDGSQTEFRIQHELQLAGIRQRRRLSHPDRVRRRERPAPEHHLGERARGGRLPQRAGLRRAGRLRTGFRNELPKQLDDDVEQPLHDLLITYQELSLRNVLESFHDATQALDTAMSLFSTGYLPLEQRYLAEKLFFGICHRIRRMVEQLEHVPEELEGWTRCSPTPTSAISRCSNRCRTAGRSTSCFPSCRFIA